MTPEAHLPGEVDPLHFVTSLLMSLPDSQRREWTLAKIVSAEASRGAGLEATRILEQIQGDDSVLFALRGLAEHLPASGDVIRARVSELSRKIASPEKRRQLLDICVLAGLSGDALKIARSFQDPYDRIAGLVSVSVKVGTMGQMSEALQLLEESRGLIALVEDSEDRDAALADLANGYADLDEPERASAVIDLIHDSAHRLRPLTRMARRMSGAGAETRLAMLAKAVSSFVASSAAAADAWRMADPIEIYLRLGRFDLAQGAVASLPETPWRAELLLRIVEGATALGLLSEARAAATQITDHWSRMRAFTLVAHCCVVQGKQAEALELIHSATESPASTHPRTVEEALAIINLTEVLAAAGEVGRRPELLGQIEVAPDLPPYYKVHAVLRLVRRPKDGEDIVFMADVVNSARRITDSAPYPTSQTGSFAEMAAAYKSLGNREMEAAMVGRLLDLTAGTNEDMFIVEVLEKIGLAYQARGEKFSESVGKQLKALRVS
jgi:hypothetical protein